MAVRVPKNPHLLLRLVFLQRRTQCVADQRRQSAFPFGPWSSVRPQGQHTVLQRVRQHEASSALRPPRIVHTCEYPAQDAQGPVLCPDPRTPALSAP